MLMVVPTGVRGENRGIDHGLRIPRIDRLFCYHVIHIFCQQFRFQSGGIIPLRELSHALAGQRLCRAVDHTAVSPLDFDIHIRFYGEMRDGIVKRFVAHAFFYSIRQAVEFTALHPLVKSLEKEDLQQPQRDENHDGKCREVGEYPIVDRFAFYSVFCLRINSKFQIYIQLL